MVTHRTSVSAPALARKLANGQIRIALTAPATEPGGHAANHACLVRPRKCVINAPDAKRTADVHHCWDWGRNAYARHLLRRCRLRTYDLPNFGLSDLLDGLDC
jgi:hypothetical protein